MQNRFYYARILLLAWCCFSVSNSYSAAAIENIQRRSDDARNAIASQVKGPSLTEQNAYNLEKALQQGEAVIRQLKSEVETLRAERMQLVQVQTALTSGLIAALVTAFVAIAGAIINARNSRADRDLKRLSALEKAQELNSKGVRLPLDIRRDYL